MALRSEIQLKVQNLSIAFGGVQALIRVSFEVKKGEIFSIIGPNGAGKTVLLNCINGLYRPQEGSIDWEGRDITPLKPHQRAQLGIGRTFQKIELFKGTTVLDNIRLGRHIHLKTGLLTGAIYFGPAAREEIANREFIEREIIDLLEIEPGELRQQPAAQRPGRVVLAADGQCRFRHVACPLRRASRSGCARGAQCVRFFERWSSKRRANFRGARRLRFGVDIA